MKRVLWIPVEGSIEVIDLDTKDWIDKPGVKESDPYRIGQVLHRELAQVVDRRVWQEKVRTPFNSVVMMIDEEGLLENLPHNSRASRFYPGRIVGDVMLCRIEVVYTGDGPEENVVDMGGSAIERFHAALTDTTRY